MNIRILTTIVAFASLISCSLAYSNPTYRYRLTVEVDTPIGVRAGTSVIEGKLAETWHLDNLSAGPNIRPSAVGEAVVVKLPNDRHLFAILKSEDVGDWASNIIFAFVPRYRGEGANRETWRAINRIRGERELPRYSRFGFRRKPVSAYPILVTFDDLVDPASVKRVNPDDLETTFGDGISLKRITVQITDDSVTTGIQELLPWLGQIKSSDLTQSDLPDGIPAGEFSDVFRLSD